ncbi:hypothetical protein FPV67DRAFT_1648203 [Lyophyllum atratum]|nr:hypothetical protein FPV67DRAFT_1648203 [Lyophyllum atratum]
MREANLDVIHARGTSAWNAFQAWQRINGSRPSDPNEILEWSTGMRERYAATIAGKTKAEVKTLMETWVTEVKKVGGDSDVVNRLSVARKRLGEIAANIASYGDAEVLIALVPLSENRVAPQLRTLMSGSGLMQQLIAREANKVVINKVLNGYSCLAQSIKNGSVKPEDVSLEQMFQFGDASTTVAKPWSWEQGPKEDHRDWKRRIVGRLFPNIFLRDLGEEKFQLYEPWNIPSILIRCRVAIVGWPHGVRIPEEGWKIRMLNSAELDSLEHAIQRKDGHQLRLQPLFEDDEEADEFNDEIGGSDWLDTAIVWVHQGATTKLKSGLIIRDCKSYCERRDAKMHGHEDGHSVTPSPSPSRRKRPRRKDMTKARSTKLASKNRKTSNTSKTSTSGDEGQKETTSTGPTTRGPKARPPKTPNPRRRKRARVEDSSEVEDPTPRPKIVTHAPIPFKLDANLTSSEADAPVLARPIAAAGTQRMPAAGNRPTPAAGTRPIIPLAHARAMPIAGGQSARIRPQPNQPFARATRGEHMPLVNMARSSQPPVLGAVRQQQLRFPPAPRQQSRDIANVGVVHRAPPTNAAYRPPPIQHNAVAGPSRPRDPWHAVQGRAARNPQRQYFVVDNTGYVQDEYAPDGYDDDEYMGEQYMGDAYGDVGAYDGGVAYSFQHEQDAGGNRFFGGRA